VAVSSTALTDDDDQEGYLTSNSLEYQGESDSGSEFEQGSDGDSATISDVGSGDGESLPPSRPALKKSKSKQSMASSEAVGPEEFEQALFQAVIEESIRTAAQERKLGQSSAGAGSSRAAAPLPNFDDGSTSELSEEDIPLKPKSKGKARGKGKATADWDDSDVESESEVAGEFDAPELTAKEKKALDKSNDPVKIHQRAMVRKLGRKLTHVGPIGFSHLDLSHVGT
jgi:hypothetical protein